MEQEKNLPVKESNFQLTLEKIPEALEKVRQEIAALEGPANSKNKKDVEIRGFGKISQIEKVSQCILARASVKATENAYNEELKHVKQKVLTDENFQLPSYKIDGVETKEVLSTLDKRILSITHKDKLKALKEVEAELAQHLSEEDKLKQTMSKIGNKLTNLTVLD